MSDTKNRKSRKSLGKTGVQGVRMHIRRCHLCGGVTETDHEHVTHCESCGKPMAPFFFFNEIEAPLYSDVEMRPPTSPGDRTPIRGLTAYW